MSNKGETPVPAALDSSTPQSTLVLNEPPKDKDVVPIQEETAESAGNKAKDKGEDAK